MNEVKPVTPFTVGIDPKVETRLPWETPIADVKSLATAQSSFVSHTNINDFQGGCTS